MAALPPFGGEENPERPPEECRFHLIPVPYERTTTYRNGTAAGPAALLAASHQVEFYDEELGLEGASLGIWTHEPHTTGAMPDELARILEGRVGECLDAGHVPGCLGGEHSISLGPIRAAVQRHPGLGVLQIDAHPDLRDEYEGTRFGHGCVMRRVLDEPDVGALVQVGLRAVSADDRDAMAADGRVRPFFAHALHGRPAADWIPEIVDALPEHVYLTFDLDGLDPSILPGTGTPEPGGLLWWDALALLREVARRRKVVAFDVVELMPEPPSVVSDFCAARLVLKILGYLATATAERR